MGEQDLSWFSASLLRASDWDKAFERALEIGKGREETYTNSDGESVVWRFAEVVHLE